MLGLITFALIIGLIWLEVVVFALVGDAIGVFLTILGVFVTAAIGIRLFRASGQATMARMAETVRAGRPPVFDVADGMAIMLAAGLLLIPGYTTDALGLILFIPGLRLAIIFGLYGLMKPLFGQLKNRSRFQFSQSNGFGANGFGAGGFKGGFGQNPNQNPNQDQSENPFQHNTRLEDDPSSTIIEGDYERKDKD